MHDTLLKFCWRIDTTDRFLKALKIVYASYEHIFQPSVLQLTEDIQPEAGTFMLPQVHAQ